MRRLRAAAIKGAPLWPESTSLGPQRVFWGQQEPIKMKTKASTDGLGQETKTGPVTDTGEGKPGALPPEGKAVTTQEQAKTGELMAPAGTSAALRYKPARVELAQIEQEVGVLEEQKTAIERISNADVNVIVHRRDDALADVDRKLADATLRWNMVVQQCKAYEASAARDVGMQQQQ